MIFFLFLQFSICFKVVYSQDYDCDQSPPISVEPLTCCKISKPFDRTNFPECFVDSLLITTTIPPPTTTLGPLPTIPVTELVYDDDYPINNRGGGSINGYGNNDRRGGNGNGNSNRNQNRNRNNNNRRRTGNDRFGNGNNDDNDYRGESSNDNERRSGGGGGGRDRDSNQNDHWKHHWGYGHHHGDYHRFDYHGRHRRQAVFQPSGLRNVRR